MHTSRSFLVVVLLLLMTTMPSRAERRVVAYVPNWIDLEQFAPTIDYAKVTHINVAFENPTNDAGELSFNTKNQVLIAAARAAGVKVLVSIGGGAASEDKTLRARYDALLTKERRAAFAAQLAGYVAAHRFDGLDVDLEGPAITADYAPFIAELRREFTARKLLLTAALSVGYGGDRVPDATLAHFDWVNIMAYDATGPWNPKAPGPHSSLDFAEKSARHWLAHGLPKEKVVLGLPFYGYAFGDSVRKGEWSYSEIVDKFPGAENSDEAGRTIYYNGLATIRAKSRFVREQGLGGVMIWTLDSDAKGKRSLLTALNEELRGPSQKPAAPTGRK